MYSEKADNPDEIKYVLDNLCSDTITELLYNFGEDYKNEVFNQIINTKEKYFVRLKTKQPVGVFGLIPMDSSSRTGMSSQTNSRSRSAGIFLLTTDNLHNGNIITFLREAKKQIAKWLNEYDVLVDTHYKKNLTIKKWLELLGFKPSNDEDENFRNYYHERN